MGIFNFFRTKKPSALSRDAKVIEQLKIHGSAMEKPHDVDFFFYLPDGEAAENFAVVLRQDDFEARVSPAADGADEYCVSAVKAVVPSVSGMENLSLHLGELAQTYGGTYDGWGTEIVE